MSKTAIPTKEEVLRYAETLSNWGRWGAQDQLGTINLVTEEKQREAAALVKDGVSVSCAWPITRDLPGDPTAKVLLYMTVTGEGYVSGMETETYQKAEDFIGLEHHGYSITHVDALCHVFWNGRMYNGLPSSMVNASRGATAESIDLLADGVVTRGVLLDVARLRGVPWLEPGEPIFPEELEAAEEAQRVRVTSGDVLLVRTGHLGRHHRAGPLDLFGRTPGSHAACIPWFRERDIAMLGSDTSNDLEPSGYDHPELPIHQICIPSMGLWLIDNANLEGLSEACAQRGRWEFLLTIAPLRIQYGTGSPVNPIAVL